MSVNSPTVKGIWTHLSNLPGNHQARVILSFLLFASITIEALIYIGALMTGGMESIVACHALVVRALT